MPPAALHAPVAVFPRSTYSRASPPMDLQRGRGKSERDEEGEREGGGREMERDVPTPRTTMLHQI